MNKQLPQSSCFCLRLVQAVSLTTSEGQPAFGHPHSGIRIQAISLAQQNTLQVARWFFRVGGAAGTIAKSVSAYDMTISDSMYGAAKRCAPGSLQPPGWLV